MKEEESNIMKAMILDVDGTLWDTTGVVAEAWMQAASELMIPECSVYVKYHCFHNIRFLFFHLKSSENQKRFQVQYSIDSAWEEEKETLESRWMRSPQTSFRLCQNLSALL
jgi:beta-phosphoglucomutase-like phosphatase (HAD superfamily)